MSGAKERLESLKDTITQQSVLSPAMSVPIDNEIKGKLALITGASGGYVSYHPPTLRQALTYQIPASAPHVHEIYGLMAPHWP